MTNVITFTRPTSSVLPGMNRMTFVEAEVEIATLLEAGEKLMKGLGNITPAAGIKFDAASELQECILKSQPKTLADTLVIANVLTGDSGYAIGNGYTELQEVAIKNVRDFIAGLVPGQAA